MGDRFKPGDKVSYRTIDGRKGEGTVRFQNYLGVSIQQEGTRSFLGQLHTVERLVSKKDA
jgi:hypothetical protein